MIPIMQYKTALYHLKRIKLGCEEEHLDTEAEALDIAINAIKFMISREDDGK